MKTSLLISLLILISINIQSTYCEQFSAWKQFKNFLLNYVENHQFLEKQNDLSNEQLLEYRVDGALAWANSCCHGDGCEECRCVSGGGKWCTSTGCACAEFVSKALRKGGLGIPVIVNTYALRDELEKKGWKHASSVQAGDAVFYNEPGELLGHVCFGVGHDVVDCHNVNTCHAGAKYQGEIALILRP